MRKLEQKKRIAIILCVVMLVSIVMPHFALDEETIESLNVEQTSVEYSMNSETMEESTTDMSVEYVTETLDETIIETFDETTGETIEESITETSVDTTDETPVETMDESLAESAIETSNETTDETSTETIIETSIDLTTNIEEETPSEASFIECEEIEANSIINNNIANDKIITTASEIENLFGDNTATNSDINNPNNEIADIEKPVKKRIDNTKKHLNAAKPAGFTVDIVKRDEDSNGLYGSNLNLPDRYDSREHQNEHGVNIVPPVRDQGSYGTCWAFGSIGAIETSIRSKNLITSENDEGADLSETALALFVVEGLEGVTDNNSYIDYPGVEGADYNCINYDYYMNVQHIPRASMSFAESGGNEISALLMASTYMGIVSENDFPYTVDNIEAIKTELRTTGLDNSRKPYAFNRNKYEVLNVDFLSKADRTSVKEAIMERGSVAIGYYESRDNCNCHEDNGEWYYLCPLKACRIEDDGSCGEEIALGQNHAVTVVGWDDNIPRDKFYYNGEIYENRTGYDIASYSIIEDDSGIYYPTYENASAIHSHSDGAWLVRNSWGTNTDMHKDGYFWLPYDTLNFDDIICAVDAGEANTYLYNYHYDTTADKSTYNYLGKGKLANVFQVSPDIDQVLDAVSIAWKSANFDYDIYIYTNENKMSNPEDGTLMLSQTVHNTSAGIKTVNLDKSVLLPKDTYFSIIVKPNNDNIVIFSENTYVDPNSDCFYYDEVQFGESWENDNGTWRDMNANPIATIGDRIYGSTPRIRGLTNEARIITFDAGGGTGTMLPQGIKYGSSGQINANEFVRSGYTFDKWIDNYGNEYADKEDIVLNNNITLKALWKKNSSPTPSGGDSGGSGGGSGGPILPTSQVIETFEVSAVKVAYPAIDSSKVSWMFDPKTSKFKLNININGQNVPATNGFFTVNELETKLVNNAQVQVAVQNTYYFNSEGSMLTGFVKTSDGKTYFFENAKTKDEGKMVIGWKKILDYWYYFNADGSMLVNGISPDGYKLGSDGKMII